MIRHFLECLRNREFWIYAAWLETAVRYRTARLGLLWLVINPAMFGFGLGFVYSEMMERPASSFIPHLVIGYSMWRLMIHVLTESSLTFKAAKPFIMEGNINLVRYILRVISKAVFNFSFSLIVVVAALAIFHGSDAVWVFTILFTFPAVLINMVWLGTLIGILGARLPETNDVINTLLLFGFLLTPIMWDAQMIPADSTLGLVVRMNPAFHIIEFVRSPMTGVWPGDFTLLYMAAFTLIGLSLANWVYRRYQPYVPLWI